MVLYECEKQLVAKRGKAMDTVTCGRCGGTGHYSYNILHGRRCYGCQGRGVVPAKAKARGARITSLPEYAEVDDIIDMPAVGKCKVVEIRSGQFQRKGAGQFDPTYPQAVIGESLVDGKKYRHLRAVPVTEKMFGDTLCRVNKRTRIWSPVD